MIEGNDAYSADFSPIESTGRNLSRCLRTVKVCFRVLPILNGRFQLAGESEPTSQG